MLFSCVPFSDWKEDEKRECVLVIIGKQLEDAWVKEVFHSAAIVRPKEIEEIKGRDHDHSDDDHSHSDEEDEEEEDDKKKEEADKAKA